MRSFLNVTVPGVRSATTLVVILATITGANLFTEPYLLTSGGGPDGASASPVFVMYQKGIEQGNPDIASAIGVVLVIACWSSPWSTDGSWNGTDMKQRRLERARLLVLGALVFLFPFYYMVVGSLQKKPGHLAHGRVPHGGLTLRQLQADQRAGSTWCSRCSTPVIFTGGVLLGTVVFGVLAGYALARLHFRGRGSCSR